MRLLLLPCLLFSTVALFAKPPEWYHGVIVLSSQEVRSGEISLEAVHDLVLFRKGDTVTVYPAHKVTSLFFYDAANNINHKYISIKEDHGIHHAYHLYEVVLQGELSVWRKATVARPNSDKFDFDYFIRYNEKLLPLLQLRTAIYPQLSKTSRDAIFTFTSRQNLDPNQPAHAIRIIEFYNRQVKENMVAANY